MKFLTQTGQVSLLMLGLASSAAFAQTQAQTSNQSVNQASAKQSARPQPIDSKTSYQLLQQSAQGFAQSSLDLYAITSQCESNFDLKAAQNAWQAVMSAWMALQGLSSGPTDAQAQSWNVQFWPDKKNITGKKMAQLVKTPALWNAADLSKQSVTVQGLGALEWLLYDASSPFIQNDAADYKTHCALLTAVNTRLNQTSESIAKAWSKNPWPALDTAQWQHETVSLLSHQLAFVISKIERPLAKVGKPRPYFAESWRSKTSLNHIQDNLAAMHHLYLAKDGLKAQLLAANAPELAQSIDNQFSVIEQTFPSEASLFNLLAPQDKSQAVSGYRSALHLKNQLEQLAYLIDDEAAVTLGVTVGFNSTDGD